MKVQPISAMYKNTNDTRREGKPVTKESVLEQIKLFKELNGEDSSTVVNLSTDKLPEFLYNKDGKIK
ncbi:hypothetical protein GAP32_024 [Cronobacter phage vB_CsaM_GAP32]|uniref:Uncharacterized protein n=1 Tax=Cronobacter phage vB_CsaM_GAP32 TaxID=1141136 RepID=K4F745_9CAUD|nr:hypothetical protein GAP32_024 [Cronobacter phage vB_CsaM_GAP32]AFC21472.1 hypothetical protein GAP32_024 [Cronobacter phage vB_CsaM_GAP32]